MKILYILKTNYGAAWAFRQAKWIKDNFGVEFVVVIPNETEGYASKYKEEGMKVIEADLSLPLKKPWLYKQRKRLLNEIVNKEKPDLIHCHFVINILFSRIALKKSKIPRLFQVPGPLHLENFFFRNIEIGLKNQYDYWAGACKKTCEIYRKNNIEDDRVFLCYYGDDIKSIMDVEPDGRLRAQYGIGNDTEIVSTVSYFYKPKYYLMQFRGLKGHEDFLDAMSIVCKKRPGVKAVVVGGPWGNSQRYMDKVCRYAKKKCGDSVIFTGYRNDVLKIYKEMDVVVHPSHSENLGGALESLALSVPTISTNVGGFTDIVIDNETGYVVDKKSPEQLAAAILKMLENKQKAKEMAKNGQKIVYKLCDINSTAKSVYDTYCEILSRKDR